MTHPPRARRGFGRAARVAWEATASLEELRAALLSEVPPWPRARWRLEGSAAGPSRLLRRQQAAIAQARHGGRLVEVLPAYRDRARAAAPPRRRKAAP